MNIFEQLERKNAEKLRPNASVVFYNDTPSGWDAVIVQVGVTFTFQNPQGQPDGSDVVQQQCNLPAGGPPATVTSRVNKCCRDNFIAMTVTMPGQPPQLVSGWSGQPAAPDECKIACEVRLVPKANLKMGVETSIFDLVIS